MVERGGVGIRGCQKLKVEVPYNIEYEKKGEVMKFSEKNLAIMMK